MPKTRGILVAGIASGAAYLIAQAIDIAVTGHRTDDRVLLGRLTPVPPSRAVPVGVFMHLANSVAFSAAFRLLAVDRLRGPYWWRGLVFANLENVALYPMAILEDFHPAVRDGQVDTYQHPTAFAQEVWRHSVMGIVLGSLTPRH